MERRYSLDSTVVLTAVMVIMMAYIGSLRAVEGWNGINWGRQTSHRLIPSMVVDLLLQNGIKNLKLFSRSDNVLKAFANCDITIHMTLPNEGLKNMEFPGPPEYWLQNRIHKYQNLNVKLRYLPNVGYTHMHVTLSTLYSCIIIYVHTQIGIIIRNYQLARTHIHSYKYVWMDYMNNGSNQFGFAFSSLKHTHTHIYVNVSRL